MKKKILFLSFIIVIIVILLTIIIINNYVPSDEKIIKKGLGNLDTGKDFVDNQVILWFEEDTDFKDVKKIVWKLNATIDTEDNSIINMYAITLNNKIFNSEEEIDKYCKQIMKKYNQIEDCSINTIIPLDDCSKGPC